MAVVRQSHRAVVYSQMDLDDMEGFDPGGKARYAWRYVYGENPAVSDLRNAMLAELGRDPQQEPAP